MNQKISACIIAKNEEKYIESCLQSILPVASEIIVLDTGSTDKTKNIVGAYRDTALPLSETEFSELKDYQNLKNNNERGVVKLYETTWEDDFAKARNQCMSYATGDWLLIIDADETLAEDAQNKLLPFLDAFPDKDRPLVFEFKTVKPYNKDDFTENYYKHTLLKNGMGIHFRGIVHEYPTRKENDLIFIECPLFIIHHNYMPQSEEEFSQKMNKYINRLLKAIEINQGSLINFHYYRHLGDSFFKLNIHDKALEAYMNSYNLYKQTEMAKQYNNTYENVLTRVIRELVGYFQEYGKAMSFIIELLTLAPDSLNGLFYYGYCQHHTGNIDQAIIIYQKAFKIAEKQSNLSPLLMSNLNIELTLCYKNQSIREKGS